RVPQAVYGARDAAEKGAARHGRELGRHDLDQRLGSPGLHRGTRAGPAPDHRCAARDGPVARARAPERASRPDPGPGAAARGSGPPRAPAHTRVGTPPHGTSITPDEISELKRAIPDFAVDSIPGSGQFIHEEQPAVVLAAVARLDGESR